MNVNAALETRIFLFFYGMVFTLDNVFSIVRNSTFDIDHVSREIVMNSLCANLNEQWETPHEILAKQMDLSTELFLTAGNITFGMKLVTTLECV